MKKSSFKKHLKYLLVIISIIFILIFLEIIFGFYYQNTQKIPAIYINPSENVFTGKLDYIILGDSVCMGYGIDKKKSYLSYMIKYLDDSLVYGFCNDGADMLDHYVALNNLMKYSRPDNIILLITMYNDFENRGFFIFGKSLVSLNPAAYFTITNPFTTESRLIYTLLKKSDLFYYFATRSGIILYKLNNQINKETPYRKHMTGKQGAKIDYQSNIKLLEWIIKTARENDINIQIVTFPYPGDIEEQMKNKEVVKGYKSVNQVCDKHNIACYHLINLFKNIENIDDYAAYDKIHPNEELSKVMAKFTVSKILNN